MKLYVLFLKRFMAWLAIVCCVKVGMGPPWHEGCLVLQWVGRYLQLKLWGKIPILPEPGAFTGDSGTARASPGLLRDPTLDFLCLCNFNLQHPGWPSCTGCELDACALLCAKSDNFFVSGMRTSCLTFFLRCCYKQTLPHTPFHG